MLGNGVVGRAGDLQNHFRLHVYIRTPLSLPMPLMEIKNPRLHACMWTSRHGLNVSPAWFMLHSLAWNFEKFCLNLTGIYVTYVQTNTVTYRGLKLQKTWAWVTLPKSGINSKIQSLSGFEKLLLFRSRKCSLKWAFWKHQRIWK